MTTDNGKQDVTGGKPRVGVYVCHCGTNISDTVDVENVAKWAAEELDEDGVISLAGKCLDFFKEKARRLERTGRLMRRTPLEDLKEFLKG